MRLIYITNNPNVAAVAEAAGVDWIFVDLEILGKPARQSNMDTVISGHTVADVGSVKKVLKTSKLIVRVNPLNENSQKEIEEVIHNGADIIMLPYFKAAGDVAKFISHVNGKAKTCILIETPEAVAQIDSVLELRGIDYAYIGLNDLHLGYRMKFLFEPLTNGTVELVGDKIKARNIPFGFGGIAGVNHGLVPAEVILAEHIRLGSSMVILSRTFCNSDTTKDLNSISNTFRSGIAELRNCESKLRSQPPVFFSKNKEDLAQRVANIVRAKAN